MTQKIYNFLKGYSNDPNTIDKLFISTYLRLNSMIVRNNNLLKAHIIREEDGNDFIALKSFSNIIYNEKSSIGIEDLIELFEFVISPAEKVVNGAVYTPEYIRKHIVNIALKNISNDELCDKRFADISCGCGGFFFTLVLAIRERINISFEQIYQNNIFGVDIEPYSIKRTKLLLSLLAFSLGEDITEFEFNLYVGNSLEFDWKSNEIINRNNGFDAIIGNPPYVSSSKIDERSKILLENWAVSKTGKPDLYIPFFQIGIENLKYGGILGYITVNNFYRSLNGRGIRNYLSENKLSISIIDFGSEQIFRGRSTYTCICFITKDTNGNICYTKSDSKDIDKLQKTNFIDLEYNNLSNHDGWVLQSPKISTIINKIETTGKKLGNCFDIKNGFATLKNDIFLFTPINEDEHCYYFKKNGVFSCIEKSICRDAIKPNTLKNEGEIISKTEKLIFPYSLAVNKTVCIINEDKMKQEFPLAYKYLSNHKPILNQRDKGKRDYETWYAFGRNQAITISGYKLLFPYISNIPYFVYSNQKDLLFYNGYALVSENEEDLLIAQKVLNSKLFWFYITKTSKPYGSNYFALAKNYVKNFGYHQFTESEKKHLLSISDKNEIDLFLMKIYDVNI